MKMWSFRDWSLRYKLVTTSVVLVVGVTISLLCALFLNLHQLRSQAIPNQRVILSLESRSYDYLSEIREYVLMAEAQTLEDLREITKSMAALLDEYDLLHDKDEPEAVVGARALRQQVLILHELGLRIVEVEDRLRAALESGDCLRHRSASWWQDRRRIVRGPGHGLPHPPTSRQHRSHSPMKSPTRVLIVDEEPQIGRLFRDILDSDHYEVHFATSEHEAAVLLTEPFDLLVLHRRLPHVTCENLVRAARQHREPAVVLLSSEKSREAERNMLLLGAAEILYKPLNPLEVRACVERNRQPKSVLQEVSGGPGSWWLTTTKWSYAPFRTFFGKESSRSKGRRRPTELWRSSVMRRTRSCSLIS